MERLVPRWKPGCLDSLVLNRDLLNPCSVLDGHHHIHVTGQAENGVHTIEMRLGFMNDEELAATGVLTGMCHRQSTGDMLLAVDFAIDHVTRATSSGRAA